MYNLLHRRLCLVSYMREQIILYAFNNPAIQKSCCGYCQESELLTKRKSELKVDALSSDFQRMRGGPRTESRANHTFHPSRCLYYKAESI